MKLSSSYILPVIFCVLSHELWFIWSPMPGGEKTVVEEKCIEEVEDDCLDLTYTMMIEEKC